MSETMFSRNGYIEKNIEDMHRYLVEENNDHMVLLIIGNPNTGKSSLSTFIVNHLTDGDIDFSNYAFNHDDWHGLHTSRPMKKKIVYEEGRDSFYRRNANTSENKEAFNALYEYRKYQHVNLINFQNITDLEPDLATNIAHGCFRCVKKGRVWFYNRNSLKNLFDDRGNFKGWSSVDPDFKDDFNDPSDEIPEVWEAYEQHSLDAIDSEEEEESNEEEEDVQYLSTGTVAEKLDVSPATVRNWCDKGKFEGLTKLPNGDRRIPESEVEEILEA